jgi:hypothetical protein
VLTEKAKQQAVEALEPLCEKRSPIWVRDQVALQFRIEGRDVVLYEKRPRYDDPSRWVESYVAKFRFCANSGLWSLLWRDRNLKWHYYEPCEADADINVVLEAVDADPTGIFWG